jgi:hypothetical protein
MKEKLKKLWTAIKPFIGIAVKGAKWYVKARYGVDVDKVLAETTPIGDDVS